MRRTGGYALLAAGCLIVPACGASSHLARSADAGPGFTDADRDAIRQMSRDDEAPPEGSATCREYALSNLTWDIKAQRTVEIYRWAIEGSKGRPPAPYAERWEAGQHAA